MARKLYFDIRDIPAGARLGLGGRKIWLFFKSLVLSWLVWSLFTYLGWLAADPGGLGAVMRQSRLLPLPGGLFWQSWQAVAILAAGVLGIAWVMLSASLKASRITFEEIRGDDFYSGRDAARFFRGNWKPLAATPLVIAAGLLLAVLALFLLGLLGRIPAAGPVIFGLLAVPAWGASLLAVLAAVALLACIPLLPPIIATTRGDTFETLFELFSTLTSQPWRIVLYGLASAASNAAGLALFMVAASLATGFLSWAAGLGMGDPPGSVLVAGLSHLAPALVGAAARPADILGLAGGGSPTVTGGGMAVISAAGAAIVLVLLSYLLSACSSGWTLIYLAVRNRKDGEDLVRRADEEEFREFERQYGSADEYARTAPGSGGSLPPQSDGATGEGCGTT